MAAVFLVLPEGKALLVFLELFGKFQKLVSPHSSHSLGWSAVGQRWET
jgi:hypothetical protein